MIDWGRVNALRAEIGAEDFHEVVDLFLEEADEVAARLSRPAVGVRREADCHFLKGSALNLGFDALASLCHVGEQAAAQGMAVDTKAIVAAYRDSRAAFIAGLAAAGGRARVAG